MKTAVYAGSFDPFTNGHLSVVAKASNLFDKVYVVIASNSGKNRFSDVNEMKDAIENCLANRSIYNCQVVVWEGLVADYCKNVYATYLVRGLRSTSDYMYEENIAKINQEINPMLQTIYFRADNDVISSSMVRELRKYGKNIAKYIPLEIGNILK